MHQNTVLVQKQTGEGMNGLELFHTLRQCSPAGYADNVPGRQLLPIALKEAQASESSCLPQQYPRQA